MIYSLINILAYILLGYSALKFFSSIYFMYNPGENTGVKVDVIGTFYQGVKYLVFSLSYIIWYRYNS